MNVKAVRIHSEYGIWKNAEKTVNKYLSTNLPPCFMYCNNYGILAQALCYIFSHSQILFYMHQAFMAPHHSTEYLQYQSRDLCVIIKRSKNQSKNTHNYHMLAYSQILLQVHQASIVFYQCIKYEQQQS